MRIYDQENTTELVEIICNKCGKRISVTKGVPQEDSLHIEKNWGLGYAGCLFVGDRRYDAAAKKMADLIDDTI